MKLLMYLKKMMLGAVVSAVPVVIAACYGPYYSISGYVTDSETEDAIPGIEVTCTIKDDWTTPSVDEGREIKVETNVNGYYGISVQACDIMKFKDVDGAENGLYKKKTVYVNYDQDFTGSVALKRLDD